MALQRTVRQLANFPVVAFSVAPGLFSWLMCSSTGFISAVLHGVTGCFNLQRTYKRQNTSDLTMPWLAFFWNVVFFFVTVLWSSRNLFEDVTWDTVVFLVFVYAALVSFTQISIFAAIGLEHHARWEKAFDTPEKAGPFHIARESGASLAARGARLLLYWLVSLYTLWSAAFALFALVFVYYNAPLVYVTIFVFNSAGLFWAGWLLGGVFLLGALIMPLAIFMQYPLSGALALAFAGCWSPLGVVPRVKSTKTRAKPVAVAQPAWIIGDDGYVDNIADLETIDNDYKGFVIESSKTVILKQPADGAEVRTAWEAHTPRSDTRLSIGAFSPSDANAILGRMVYRNNTRDIIGPNFVPDASPVAEFAMDTTPHEYAETWTDGWSARGLQYLFTSGPVTMIRDTEFKENKQVLPENRESITDFHDIAFGPRAGDGFENNAKRYWYMAIQYPHTHTPYGVLAPITTPKSETDPKGLRARARITIPAFFKSQRRKLFVVADMRLNDPARAARTEQRMVLDRIAIIPPLAVARAAAQSAQGYMKLPDTKHGQSVLERYRLVSRARKLVVFSWPMIIWTFLTAVALPLAAGYAPAEIAGKLATGNADIIRALTLLAVGILEGVLCAWRLAAIARYTAPMAQGQRTGHFPFGNPANTSDFKGKSLPVVQWAETPGDWAGAPVSEPARGDNLFPREPRRREQALVGATSAPEYAWVGTDHAYSAHEYTTHMIATLDAFVALTPFVLVVGAALWIFLVMPTTVTFEFLFARAMQASFFMHTWTLATSIAARFGAVPPIFAAVLTAGALLVLFIVDLILRPLQGILPALIALAGAIGVLLLSAALLGQWAPKSVVTLKIAGRFEARESAHFAYGDDAHAMHAAEQLRLEVLNQGLEPQEGTPRRTELIGKLQQLEESQKQSAHDKALVQKSWYDLFDTRAAPATAWAHWAPLDLAPFSVLFVDMPDALARTVGQVAPMRW